MRRCIGMPNFNYESAALSDGFDFVGGVDEAGRGPLAGPVVAACVILNNVKFENRIDDSKLLSPLQREKAYCEIAQNSVVGVGIIAEAVIDAENILRATYLAMENAVYSCISKLKEKGNPYFLIDGKNMKLGIPYAFESVISGDKKSLSISCASIIAKVTRDRIMQIYDKTYPEYGFKQHKGYGTRKHIFNLKKFGISEIHRKTFYPVSAMCNA